MRAAATPSARRDVASGRLARWYGDGAWRGYLVAGLGTPAAAWLRSVLIEWFGEGLPLYATFYPVVFASAALGSTVAGLLATLTSALFAAYFLLPPTGELRLERPGDIVGLVLFFAVSLFLSFGGGRLRAVYRRSFHSAEGLSVAVQRLSADIAVREKSEAALRTNEERLRTLVDLSSQVVWVSSPQGVPTSVSPSWEAFTGRAPEQWASERWDEVIHPDDRPQVRAAWRRALATGMPVEAEYRIRHASGAFRHVHTSAAPIRNPNGEIREWIGMMTDITARRQADWERSRLAAIVAETADAVIATTLDGRITNWNLGAERVLGFPAGEALGRDLGLVGDTQFASAEANRLAAIARGEPGVRFESRWLTRDRRPVEVSVTASAIRDEAGRLTGISMIARDVTEPKRIEEALRRSERRYHSLFDAIDEAFCVLGVEFDAAGAAVDWRFLAANPAFARHSGRNDVIGRRYREICSAPETPWLKLFGDVATTGRAVRQVAYSDAFSRWLDFYAFPTGDAAERHVAVLFTDVTARRAAEQALQQARGALSQLNAELENKVRQRTAELEATVAELEQFSYTITHDMRAPLRAMQGFCAILIAECAAHFGPAHREYLERIATSAERMDRLITDALQYSRTVRQHMVQEPVDSGALLREILDSYPQFRPPHAHVHIESPLPVVLANPAALTQCFSNFLSNAIKFVGAGTTPVVRVSAESAGDLVRLNFRDNGIGIEPQYQPRIWEMFQQLDPNYPGTGIGLALVRKAAERMGGTVGVESQPGRGSCFWINLRRAAPEGDVAAEVA